MKSEMGPNGEGWVILQIIALALAGLTPPLPESAQEVPWVLIAVAAVLAVASTVLMIWSFWVLGTNLQAPPDPRQGNTLITRGPYALVRHPIYLALIGLSLAWQIARANAGGMLWVGILILVLYLKSRREEKKLLNIHPEYAAYRSRTDRLFPISFLIGKRPNH